MLDDLNRFTYVKNNPLALIDPSGMQSEGRYRKSTSVYLDCPSDCLPVFADGCRFRLTSFALYFGVGKDPPTVRHWSLKLAATPGIVPFTSLLVEETKEYFRRIGPNYYCAYLRSCFSDFDRTYTPSSFIKVTLLDGTECLFTERNFPGGMYVDDNTLPAACRGLLDFKPIRLEDPDEPVLIGGGTYHLTREVKSVVYAFDITVHCGCYLAREPDQNLAPRNQAVLTIRGSVPGDPPDRIGD
jgi:hypothetical protein